MLNQHSVQIETTLNRMRKKCQKYLLLFSTIIFAFCAYKYFKPKVFIKKEIVGNNIPPKINWYLGEDNKFGDSIILYLPYKFTIENNRLRKISIENLYYSQMRDIRGYEKTLYYDESGNPFGYLELKSDRQYLLDELLGEKKLINYFKLKNIGTIFPFTSKSVYYYKSYKLSTKVFQNGISKQEYAQISENFIGNQRKSLYHKEIFPIQKRIIDSLYADDKKQNLLFTFKKQSKSKYGFYRIKYQLANNEQIFSDFYDTIEKMSKEELYNFLSKPAYNE